MVKLVQCATIRMFQHKVSFAAEPHCSRNSSSGCCFFGWLALLLSRPDYWVPNNLEVTLKFWALAVLRVPYCRQSYGYNRAQQWKAVVEKSSCLYEDQSHTRTCRS